MCSIGLATIRWYLNVVHDELHVLGLRQTGSLHSRRLQVITDLRQLTRVTEAAVGRSLLIVLNLRHGCSQDAIQRDTVTWQLNRNTFKFMFVFHDFLSRAPLQTAIPLTDELFPFTSHRRFGFINSRAPFKFQRLNVELDHPHSFSPLNSTP
jgi:hypothetical protein